jgi:DNA invertase Pin-like site-specific DNA recombinase
MHVSKITTFRTKVGPFQYSEVTVPFVCFKSRRSIGMIYGYARDSSDGQSLENQLAQLKAAGSQKTYLEKVSGRSRANRAELARLLAKLTRGDVLIVSRLDRLARSSRDLLNILHEVGEKQASFKSLGDAWADTTTAHGRLLVTILAGLAEWERELIKTRTSEGRVRAKRDGVRFGRPHKLTSHQVREAIARREAGETLRTIGRSYNVSPPTILRLTHRAGR